jgi:hypothetical protein
MTASRPSVAIGKPEKAITSQLHWEHGVRVSARNLPLVASPDVVACGGTVAAVAAALAARQEGLAVLLVAPRLYLGEEWCSTLRLAPILIRLLELDATVTLSHHHSCALALEALGRIEAARPLAELLGKPGMSGNAMLRIEPLPDQPRDHRRREAGLREIVLARALWRCGDWEAQGRANLETYRQDIRGYFARHAEDVLATPVHQGISSRNQPSESYV